MHVQKKYEIDAYIVQVGILAQDTWVFPKIGGKPPKSSILIGFSIINHPFWGTPIFGNIHITLCPSYFFLESVFFWQNHHKSPTNWALLSRSGRHGEERHASVERLDLLQWQLQGKGWEEMHLGMEKCFKVIG